MSLIIFPVGIHHRYFYAVHKTHSVNAHFPIVETIVHLLDGRSVKNPARILELNPMPFDIAAVGSCADPNYTA